MSSSKQGYKVKCTSILDLKTLKFLYTHSLNDDYFGIFSNELSNLLQTLQRLHLSPRDYQKVHTSSGIWLCSVNNNRVAYLLLVHGQYPVTTGTRLARFIKERLGSIELMERNEIEKIFSKEIDVLMKLYDRDEQCQATFNQLDGVKESLQVKKSKPIPLSVHNLLIKLDCFLQACDYLDANKADEEAFIQNKEFEIVVPVVKTIQFQNPTAYLVMGIVIILAFFLLGYIMYF